MASTPSIPEAETTGASRVVEESAPRRGLAARLVRPVLLLLALGCLLVGLWLVVSPRSFYDDYPGFGRAWVSVDGPYNEHAFRDFGDSQLAIAVVLLAAFVRPQRYIVRAAALAYMLFAVPHLVYHATHLDVFDSRDKVAVIFSLGVTVVLPAILVFGSVRGIPGPSTHNRSYGVHSEPDSHKTRL